MFQICANELSIGDRFQEDCYPETYVAIKYGKRKGMICVCEQTGEEVLFYGNGLYMQPLNVIEQNYTYKKED